MREAGWTYIIIIIIKRKKKEKRESSQRFPSKWKGFGAPQFALNYIKLRTTGSPFRTPKEISTSIKDIFVIVQWEWKDLKVTGLWF